jgi:hypothetical protein
MSIVILFLARFCTEITYGIGKLSQTITDLFGQAAIIE